nr:DNA-binding protein [uncultured Mediterranean phage uvMED]
MTLHKNRVNAALAMIAEKQLNPTDVERICGVNRTQIYRWKAGEVKQMRYDSFTKLAKALNYTIEYKGEEISITPNTNKQNQGDLNMEQQQMLIKYQQQEIEQLKDKINQHGCVYDGIQSDIVFAFEIKFNWSLKKPGVKVKYLSQDSDYVPVMAQKLGYTELEMSKLLQIDEMVDYREHNIHQLRTEEQKDEMLSMMDVFMKAYNSIKVNTTMLVAEIPVLYTHKNGTVYKSNVEYRINWVNGTGTAHIRWLKD